MPEPVTPLPQLPDFMLEGQPNAEAGVDLELEAGATAAQDRAQQVGVKTDLRREMDLALDSARSMFTDVDRFISLGRTQSATSLLEFQVQKDPTDRDAWVKLMAVYRQEGMEAEFQRTFAEFKKKFPGEV
jgi:DNA-binding SARP family transcriptional activator